MDDLARSFLSVILIGFGATLTFDLWARFLKLAFKITPSNMCLVGRWLRYMPEGTFTHKNISASPPKNGECSLGWIAHYMIGALLAITFVALMGTEWMRRPTLVPAIIYGVVTALAPLFIMQPSFGLGFTASKTPNPAQARIRTLMNHTAFGVGLYLFAVVLLWLARANG